MARIVADQQQLNAAVEAQKSADQARLATAVKAQQAADVAVCDGRVENAAGEQKATDKIEVTEATKRRAHGATNLLVRHISVLSGSGHPRSTQVRISFPGKDGVPYDRVIGGDPADRPAVRVLTELANKKGNVDSAPLFDRVGVDDVTRAIDRFLPGATAKVGKIHGLPRKHPASSTRTVPDVGMHLTLRCGPTLYAVKRRRPPHITFATSPGVCPY